MRYKIITAELTTPGIWDVNYYYWEGCFCSRKEETIQLKQERRPMLKDLTKALQGA